MVKQDMLTTICSSIYTAPEVAVIGKTEEELKAQVIKGISINGK